MRQSRYHVNLQNIFVRVLRTCVTFCVEWMDFNDVRITIVDGNMTRISFFESSRYKILPKMAKVDVAQTLLFDSAPCTRI